MGTALNSIVTVPTTVQKVTQLGEGDVYKRLETSSYAAPKLLIGVIQSILTNGDTIAVTVIEFDSAYGATSIEPKLLAADKDLEFFPATELELATHLGSAVETAARSIDTKVAELDKARKTHEFVLALQQKHLGTELDVIA
jgi:hypothetical protein